MPRARTIKEEPEVTEAAQTASAKYARFSDLWDAWMWRLARGPEIDATPVPGSNPQAYIVKSFDFSANDMPAALTFLYTFDDDEVHIISISISAQ